MKIRSYKMEDYFMICDWWNKQEEEAPKISMMPLDSSFVLEINDMPVLAVTLYLTNSKEVCYVENFIGNPEFKNEERRMATVKLQEFIEDFAKTRGYKNLVCFTEKDKLMGRYKELGYKPTVVGLSSFVKEL